MNGARYLSCAETAKALRVALGDGFPGVKFSVRSSTYSGGASISVGWTDGPRSAAVQRLTEKFEGATFDGMNDLKSHHESTLNGEPVQFGADFIFCSRAISDFEAKVTAARAMIEQQCHVEGGFFGGHPVNNLARGMAHDCDPDGSLDGAFARVVLREDRP